MPSIVLKLRIQGSTGNVEKFTLLEKMFSSSMLLSPSNK